MLSSIRFQVANQRLAGNIPSNLSTVCMYVCLCMFGMYVCMHDCMHALMNVYVCVCSVCMYVMCACNNAQGSVQLTGWVICEGFARQW